ncbi:MAG: methyl-accepting chemotaxis protein [Thalassovita sp.]|nr:methyl-accepting chemotaxis protein [Thalassovita sp.]
MARLVALAATPIPGLSALIVGGPMSTVLTTSLIFGFMALVASRVDEKSQPAVLAVALVGQCIAFTAAFAGHAWQIDTHMTFFAALAIVATMSDVKALLLTVAVTAAHHLLVGVFLPSLVFPEMALLETIERVVFHAVVVIVEAAVLLWSMILSQKARQEIEETREKAAQSADDAKLAQQEAEKARERALATTDRTRREAQRAAVAVEQVSTAASAAAETASNAQNLVSNAKSDADKNGEVVERTRTAMEAIKDSSSEVVNIVGVIDDIARQTDLLALNAAVESARAGDAGRGFAVVATEVRKLAQRSADAAKQIRGLVATSSQQVAEGVELVGDTGEALSRIVSSVSDINDLMSDIANGAASQADGLEQLNVAIVRIDNIEEEDLDDDEGIPARADVETKGAGGGMEGAPIDLNLDDTDEGVSEDVDFKPESRVA